MSSGPASPWSAKFAYVENRTADRANRVVAAIAAAAQHIDAHIAANALGQLVARELRDALALVRLE